VTGIERLQLTQLRFALLRALAVMLDATVKVRHQFLRGDIDSESFDHRNLLFPWFATEVPREITPETSLMPPKYAQRAQREMVKRRKSS
jgi:hypothetical protein